MADGHYDAPFCGGLMAKSGKGGGPRAREGSQRHQRVWAYPSWIKTGTDVHFSSRWDEGFQIYDLFWTPKTVDLWWQTKTWEYVFVQEIPWSESTGGFVFEEAKSISMEELRKRAFFQRLKAKKTNRR